MRYKADQTGPNIQLGGVQEGFARLAYQDGIEGFVKIDPINAAPKHIPIHAPRPMSERVRLIVTSENAGKGSFDYLGSVGYSALNHSRQPPLRA
jgi:hypothetical protein